MLFSTVSKGTKSFTTPTVKKVTKDEKTMKVPGVPVGSVTYFGSGMKIHQLSNFNQCSIVGKIWVMTGFNEYASVEYTFPSSEHYWWAHFFVLDRDVKRLAIGGDLASLESGLAHFYSGEELKKKIFYWSKKGNVGIVPKLLAGKKGTKYRKRATDLGMRMSIHPSEKYGAQGADSTLSKIWTKILIAKYTQNKEHRRVLMGTGDARLVEFTRAPESRIRKEFWAGRAIEGKLYGTNYMGDCMISVRECFK